MPESTVSALPTSAELGATLLEAAEASGVVGAQVSVFDREEVRSAAIGLAHEPTSRPMRTSTSMQVGSIAKLLTAVLIHQLVDDGLLDLTAPVRDVLPDFRVADAAASAAMTPRHLLSMTSGLDFGYYLDLGDGDDAVARFVETLADAPSMFQPGEAFAYSGLSTVVSARIVQVLRGETWETVLRDRIFGPLSMSATSVDATEHPYLDVAPGHAVESDGSIALLRPWVDYRATAANGTSLLSSAADLAALGRSLAGGGASVLSDAGRTRLAEPVIPVGAHLVADHFALGSYRRATTGAHGEELIMVGHGGRWAGGVCDLLWIAETGVGMAVASNTPSRAGALILALTDALLPRLVGPASVVATSEIRMAPSELDRFAGEFDSGASHYVVRVDGDGLTIRVTRTERPDNLFSLGEGEFTVYPVGAGRFMPRQAGPVERRLQEVWFDESAEYVYDGFPGARRVR